METVDYERGLLSVALQGRGAWATASELIRPESFSQGKHAALWKGLTSHYEGGGSENIVEIRESVESDPGLSAVGGLDYLSDLLALTFPGDNPDFWTSGVHEAWRKREWHRIGATVAGRAADRNASSEEIESFVLKEMQEIAARARRRAEPIKSVMSRIVTESLRGEIRMGLTTGFPTLDAELRGFEPGQLILIAARTAVGKTTFGFNIAAHVALTLQKRVLAFSLEMTNDELAKNLMAGAGGPNLHAARGRKLNEDEAAKLVAASSTFSTSSLMLQDDADMTLGAIRSEAYAQHTADPLSLVIVDYIGLISGAGTDADSVQERISSFSRGLKVLAKDLRVPVIVMAQLNRESAKQDGMPALHHLRDSGALEQDANVVLILHRTTQEEIEAKEQGRAMRTALMVAKSRSCPRNTVIPLLFHGAQFRFTEADKFEGSNNGVEEDDGRTGD